MREPAITTASRARPRHSLPSFLAAASLLAALIVGATLLAPLSADSQAPTYRVLGNTPDSPRPACPATQQRSCMSVGSVTVFQTEAGQVAAPYRVPFHGRLVSWSITLSRPTPSEIRGFNDFYGEPSMARIAVLRRVGKTRPPIFKMVRQSPAQELRRFFGKKVHFALDRPLHVRRGHIIALTIPTWAPNWAVNLSDRNAWRASRNRRQCADSDIQDHSRPQQRVRSNRQYGCYFTNTRFLYTATVVRNPDL